MEVLKAKQVDKFDKTGQVDEMRCTIILPRFEAFFGDQNFIILNYRILHSIHHHGE